MKLRDVLKPLIFLVAVGLTAAPVIAEDIPPQKVVYHNNGSSEPDYYKHFLGNVRNHINAVGRDNIELVVVAHGDGLSMLSEAETDPDLAGKIDALKADGVRFLICANTLRSRNITLDQLYEATDADVVPSGVAEIARLEQQGFVYLHP
ncbi:MAG TPA: DsrE family protein [Amaricoccus sp.]|nr:DsrE family protein [Amaricoccus sp.]